MPKFRYISLFVFLLLCVVPIEAKIKPRIHAFGTTIYYEWPKQSFWHLDQQGDPDSAHKGVVTFKHDPIRDPHKIYVDPMLAIIYESASDTMDAVHYGIGRMGKKSYPIKYRLLEGYPSYSSDRRSAVFSGSYDEKGIPHTVLLCYFHTRRIGIEIICDATKDVYSTVEADFRKFVKAVIVKDRIE